MELVLGLLTGIVILNFAFGDGYASSGTKPSYNNALFASKLTSFASEKQNGKNFVLSPLSIELAMFMVTSGANKETSNQIEKYVFGVPESDRYYLDDYAESLFDIPKLNKKSNDTKLFYGSHVAIDDAHPIKDRYRKIVEHFFKSGLILGNFATQGDRLVALINDIVSRETNRRINNLLPSGSINSDTSLILVNALFFKSVWRTPFTQIFDGDFYQSPDDKRTVKMLTNVFSDLHYYEDDRTKAIRLPFVNTALNMYIILPKDQGAPMRQQLKNLIEGHTGSINWFLNNPKRLEPRAVEVKLPKFSMDFSDELTDDLMKMGVEDAFNPDVADFGRIFETPFGIRVSNIFHKAFIEVDENGVEAAAATAVLFAWRINNSPRPEVEFIADHPFLFYITVKHEGRLHNYETIMFAGQYNGPNA